MMRLQILFFVIAISFSTVFAIHVPPVRQLEIPVALSSAMNIDGVDDEAYYSAEQTTEAFNQTGSTGADADFTFTFKVCYDANYLYVFGKILDDFDNSWEWGDTSQWTYDCVELFIDLDTNGSGNSPSYDSNTYQLRWNRGLDSVGNDCGRPGNYEMRPQHKYYWENTADGWLFETALAWKFVLGLNQKTEDILQYCDCRVVSGFDISAYDSDTPGADQRDCQTAWDMDGPSWDQDSTDRTEDNAWKDRTVFGTVTFQTYGCGDPCEIDPQACMHNWTDEIEFKELIIYPNPVGSFLKIDNTYNIRNAAIYNVMGLELLDIEYKSGDDIIDVSGLPNNCIYFLRLTDYYNEVYTVKFVKD